MRSGKSLGLGQLHRAGITDGRPHALPVDLRTDESPPASGRQNPDAVGAEFRAADVTNGFGGLESVNQTLRQVTIGQVRSSESVA